MAMNRAEKQAEIQELSERFSGSELVVVTQYSGLTVAELSKLRGALRQENAGFKVTKNSLAKLALKGSKFEGMESLFAGPTGVATSKDPVAAAKVAHQFSKEHDKLVIIGGSLAGKILDAKAVEQLAKLPSLDEIRAKLCGVLQAPAAKMVGVLQAPARQLVGVTKAYGEKA